MNQELNNLFTWYASAVAESVQYDWSNEFRVKELKSATDRFLEHISKYIDWNNLTKEEAFELGFRLWDEASPDLYLVPLYLLPLLPVGTRLISILGKEVIYDGSNVDKDTRFGLLAYGIIIKEEEKENE